jgi:hypothetical protein
MEGKDEYETLFNYSVAPSPLPTLSIVSQKRLHKKSKEVCPSQTDLIICEFKFSENINNSPSKLFMA